MFFLFTHKSLSYVILFPTNIQMNNLSKMEDENVAISLCLIIIASVAHRIRCDRWRPRRWTCAWIHRRRQLGAHHALMKELASEDPHSYKNFKPIDKSVFYTF